MNHSLARLVILFSVLGLAGCYTVGGPGPRDDADAAHDDDAVDADDAVDDGDAPAAGDTAPPAVVLDLDYTVLMPQRN